MPWVLINTLIRVWDLDNCIRWGSHPVWELLITITIYGEAIRCGAVQALHCNTARFGSVGISAIALDVVVLSCLFVQRISPSTPTHLFSSVLFYLKRLISTFLISISSAVLLHWAACIGVAMARELLMAERYCEGSQLSTGGPCSFWRNCTGRTCIGVTRCGRGRRAAHGEQRWQSAGGRWPHWAARLFWQPQPPNLRHQQVRGCR